MESLERTAWSAASARHQLSNAVWCKCRYAPCLKNTEACSTPTTAQTNSSHPIPSTSCMESVSQTTATHSSMSETVKILSTPQSSVAETSTLSQLPVSQSTDYVTVPVTPTTSVLPSVVQCPLESASATTGTVISNRYGNF